MFCCRARAAPFILKTRHGGKGFKRIEAVAELDRELGTPLATVPDGTRLEMVFADEEDNDEGRQRWAGTVCAGQRELNATWPQVSSEVLADAVAFCRSQVRVLLAPKKIAGVAKALDEFLVRAGINP